MSFAVISFAILIFSKEFDARRAAQLFSISVLFASAFPTLFIWSLARVGRVSGLYVPKREERTLPLAGALASYTVGVACLYVADAPPDITGMMLAYSLNALVALIISQFWKISLHAAGITGPVTALVYSLGSCLAFLYLLVLPVGWSRVKLGDHDAEQVIGGALLMIPLTWAWMELSAVLF